MVYLIIQIKNDQPVIQPFDSLDDMNKYRQEKLGADKTSVAITENVYFIHIKEV